MRIAFGALLALLVAVPPLLDIAGAAATLAASQPPVLAFAAGVLTWPHLVRRARRWWK